MMPVRLGGERVQLLKLGLCRLLEARHAPRRRLGVGPNLIGLLLNQRQVAGRLTPVAPSPFGKIRVLLLELFALNPESQ